MHGGQRLLLGQQSGLDILRPRELDRRQGLPTGAGRRGGERRDSGGGSGGGGGTAARQALALLPLLQVFHGT